MYANLLFVKCALFLQCLCIIYSLCYLLVLIYLLYQISNTIHWKLTILNTAEIAKVVLKIVTKNVKILCCIVNIRESIFYYKVFILRLILIYLQSIYVSNIFFIHKTLIKLFRALFLDIINRIFKQSLFLRDCLKGGERKIK